MHCAHTACSVARTTPSRVHVARTACAGRAHSLRMSRACWACTGRDMPRQPAPGRNAKSRSRHLISTGQVGTSNRCRDQPLLLPQERPCRDLKPWSRHQTTTRQPEPCCDIKSVSRHHSGHSKSRPQNGVATPFLLPSPKPGRNTKPGRDLLETDLCRDINFMSRYQFHVATSFLPTVWFPGRDVKI